MPGNENHFTRNLQQPQPMKLTGNLSENWRHFHENWQNWSIATKLLDEEPIVVLATLKSVIGTATVDIARNLPMVDSNDPTIYLDALKEYFDPQKNITYERYLFNSATQGNDSIDLFVNRLRQLASTCEFGPLCDSLIRDRMIMGINDAAVRRRLLRIRDLNLHTCIEICRAAAQAHQQLQIIDGEAEVVNSIRTQKKKLYKMNLCHYCGKNHDKGKCPAYGRRCTKCSKFNHFSTVCESSAKTNKPQQVRKNKTKHRHERMSHHVATTKPNDHNASLDYSSGSEEEFPVYAINNSTSYIVEPKVKLPTTTEWKSVKMQIDNGSAVNCIRKQDLALVTAATSFKKSNLKLRAYGGAILEPLGQIDLCLSINSETGIFTFQIVDNATVSLISGHTSEKLGLIKVNHELLVNAVDSTKPLTKEHIIEAYKDVFTGLGNIGTCSIEIDPNAKPKQDSPRSVPVALRDELKKRLQEMEEQGILKKVTEPTDWVSSAVYVKRPGKKLRICLDPQELNKYVKRPKLRMPTLDDVTPQLGKVQVFSILDAKDGFLQVVLDETSSAYTTFHSPFGRYRWCRLPLGISCAPEEFQRRVLELIEGLPGVHAIADDTVVIGIGDTLDAAVKNHDENLVSFLEQCRKRNYKLNIDKFRFRLPEVKYHGHLLTSQGLSPDPDKVSAIVQMPRPRDKSEIKRFLGMVTYLSKFLPQLSNVSEPLRDLTRENVTFIWSSAHEKAFQQLQKQISDAPCLKYYDVNDEVSLEVDASDYGLGAVIMQQGRPVAYASRTLSETERRYSEIERECLAIAFGTQRFDQYLFGKDKITVFTDHKPLETILKKPIDAAPKRLQKNDAKASKVPT